ncbi:hypothetical protein AGMMS50239_36330 [Bacteroidia bacterium]|nr:hypothetical protein AGMMS50239_36330 [Bacteroidia bacterium]
MKKIFYIIAGMALLGYTSCMEIDNWDAPDANIHGRVIDSYTGENLVMDNNDWQIRIWERSWEQKKGIVANHQDLPVKNDGTYNNNKLFAGAYDMLPYDGPFWPVVDTIKGVVFTKKGTQQDFTVTPYLQIVDFETKLGEMEFQGEKGWPALTMRCRIKAPVRTNLPNLYDVMPFISMLANFCGNSNRIDREEYNRNARVEVRKSWGREMQERFGLPADSEISGWYETKPMPLKHGYTYYVRIGANVDVLGRKYNYSPIVKIVVP